MEQGERQEEVAQVLRPRDSAAEGSVNPPPGQWLGAGAGDG